MSLQSKLLQKLPRKLAYCDVGARGGLSSPWDEFAPLIQITGFEPDEVECARLQKAARPGDTILPMALDESPGTRPFYVTRKRACSSFYEPNFEFLKNYPAHTYFEVEKKETISTTTLDTLFSQSKVPSLDFLKLDIQGGELSVLRGGSDLLANHILGIELEVEFAPVYKNQPLFAEVDHYIQNKLGLQLQDIRPSYWKLEKGHGQGSPKGQLIFGDALYFRRTNNLSLWLQSFKREIAYEKCLMLIVSALAYNYIDLAISALIEGKNFFDSRSFEQLSSLISGHGKKLRFWKGNRHLANLFYLAFRAVEPHHKFWWMSGRTLGSKKRLGFFI